jgi:hypothetical protein
VFLPAPSEHRTTLPLLYTMETGFLLLGDGTRFPLHHQRMEHGSIPLPNWRMEQGFDTGWGMFSLHYRRLEGHFRTGASASEEWNRVSTFGRWNGVSTSPFEDGRELPSFCQRRNKILDLDGTQVH